MHEPDPWSQIATSTFVLLGTYRKTGLLVSTPVWIAPDGHELVVTTDREAGKVKRLRRNQQVTLRPCSATGKVSPDAITVVASARLDTDDTAGNAALAAKYGFQFRAIHGIERLTRRLTRKPPKRVIIRIAPGTAG